MLHFLLFVRPFLYYWMVAGGFVNDAKKNCLLMACCVKPDVLYKRELFQSQHDFLVGHLLLMVEFGSQDHIVNIFVVAVYIQ